MTAGLAEAGRRSLADLASAVARTAARLPLVRATGRVSAVTAQAVQVEGLSRFVQIGGLVAITSDGRELLAEVVRLERLTIAVRLLDGNCRVMLGSPAWPAGPLRLWPHDSWKGRLINGLGEAVDGGPALELGSDAVLPSQLPPDAMSRQPVTAPVTTGVKAMDIFTPLCLGQRIGIFAGSGVGKSSLLTMLARTEGFKTVVVALVGERGREVRDFVGGMPGDTAGKTIIVVSTGDESAAMRRLAPLSAMGVAEYFRDRGDDVLLIMDSVTRYAHACRDVALSAGEPPVARGYPPSVFGDLPKLLERAGPGSAGTGSITGVFAVLVDGDDHNDPVADAIRGTLDGHIVLDRAIAQGGRYPAIDLLASLSRLSHRAWTPDQRKAVVELRKLVARFEESRDLRSVGGYQKGADEELDRAVAIVPRLYQALCQGLDDRPSRDAFRDIADCLTK